MFPLTTIALLKVMPNAGIDRIAAWIGPLEQAMLAFQIDRPERIAAFLPQLAHESCELTKLEEDLRYSAPRLRKIFGKRFADDATAEHYAALGPAAIADHVYGGRMGNGPEGSGDGWLYRGRAAGITGRDNYRACSIATCGDADTLLKNPELLADPEFGAAGSAWFFSNHGCTAYADAGDFDGVCDVWNFGHKTLAAGDSIGYASRLEYRRRTLEALA